MFSKDREKPFVKDRHTVNHTAVTRKTETHIQLFKQTGICRDRHTARKSLLSGCLETVVGSHLHTL